MRLTTLEQQAILDGFEKTYGQDDHLWLFGSRIDDGKRGGDIDLYIETHLSTQEAVKAKFDFLRLLQDAIGEQKIDVFVLKKTAQRVHLKNSFHHLVN